MNMHHSFAPERAAAQHCPELTERGTRPEERAEFVAIWRRDTVRYLENDLTPLFMGEKLQVTIGEPEKMTGQAVFAKIGPVAVNCLLRCDGSDKTVLLSLDFANALALTDRSFGGDGAIPNEPVEQLPRSAAILIDRLALVIAQGLAQASDDGGDGAAKQHGDVIVRSESATRLKPFDPGSACVVLPVAFGPKGGEPWSMTLALREDQLDGLLPGVESLNGSGNGEQGPADPRAKPFASIPMPLDAVLAEFQLSLSKLENLRPGDEIPLAMPREIPLRIGEQPFAKGTVGTLDESMAVRLTRLSQEGLST